MSFYPDYYQEWKLQIYCDIGHFLMHAGPQGFAGVYPSCESARHGRAASSLKGYIPTSTHRKVRARTVGRSRGPRENSHRHGQNMWTPHRKDPGPGIKPVNFSLGVDRHCKPLRHCITLSKDVFSSSKGTCVTHVGCFIMVKRRV